MTFLGCYLDTKPKILNLKDLWDYCTSTDHKTYMYDHFSSHLDLKPQHEIPGAIVVVIVW